MNDERNATPAEMLERRIMDPCIAKSEAEWWAKKEIEKQRAEVERLRAENELQRAEIELQRTSRHREARAFEAEHNRLQAALNTARRERDEARAEVERLRGDAQAISAIAHTGGTAGLSEHEALVEIRRRTAKAWGGRTSRKALEAKP